MDQTRERIARIENGLQLAPQVRREPRKTAAIAERMTHYSIPGLSMAVVDGGRVACLRSYGVREAGKAGPVNPDTRFQAGSISKLVTAIAVLRLAAEGRLDLDTDVNAYLTSWTVPPNAGWQPTLTLAHLLSHTGGVNIVRQPGYSRDQELPSLIGILRGEKPANTPPVVVNMIPGLAHRYSGGGFTIIQQVLVDLLEMPFPEIMKELVIDPLGMVKSTFAQLLPEQWRGQTATAHPYGAVPLTGNWHEYPDTASAGLWTTPSDLALCIIELQRAKSGRSALGLTVGLMDRMMTSACPSTPTPGLGVFLCGSRPDERFEHLGWNLGYMTHLVGYVNDGKGAVVMHNSNQGHGTFGLEVLRAIASEYGWTGYLDEDPVAIRLDPRVYSEFEGEYRLPSGLPIWIALKGAQLFMQAAEQDPWPINMASETSFFASVMNIDGEFVRDDRGRIGMLLGDIGRADQVY